MNVNEKTLEQRLGELVLALGIDIKALQNKDAAIDAVIGDMNTIPLGEGVSVSTALTTIYGIAKENNTAIFNSYSNTQIDTLLENLKSQILGGIPPETLDTIQELADWIANDETVMAGLLSSLGKRVAVDSVQTFTDAERLQGRANIGAQEAAAIGDTNTDLVALYVAAKA